MTDSMRPIADPATVHAALPPLLTLQGTAYERGLAQARTRPDLVDAVQRAVRGRLEGLQAARQRPHVRELLAAQAAFLEQHDRSGFDESRGVADGFGLTHDELLAYLHGNVIADLARGAPPATDGCTAWALQKPAAQGALVVKNRDYRGEHGLLQHVFVHEGADLRGRRLLCVGSLGSPGAFSSGLNSDGLAVVDTQIATHDHGVGWLRYFLMTALLRRCANVTEALSWLRSVPHAGGGTLVLGDRQGRLATVELGHRTGAVVESGGPWVARTNHFVSAALAAQTLGGGDDLTDSSTARLDHVRRALQDQTRLDAAEARRLMSSHDEVGGLCRHARRGSSGTLCCAIYDTERLSLRLSHGNPCSAPWRTYRLGASGSPVLTEDAAW